MGSFPYVIRVFFVRRLTAIREYFFSFSHLLVHAPHNFRPTNPLPCNQPLKSLHPFHFHPSSPHYTLYINIISCPTFPNNDSLPPFVLLISLPCISPAVLGSGFSNPCRIVPRIISRTGLGHPRMMSFHHCGCSWSIEDGHPFS
jgi:hypothetical protein